MRLTCRSLTIPFRVPVSHAQAHRNATASVLVAAQPDGGAGDVVGLGEGCPRGWVTGEDVAGALAWLDEQQGVLSRCETREQVRTLALLSPPSVNVDAHPAAFCAAELAMLDAIARHDGVSLEGLLGVPSTTSRFAMSAVLFDAPRAAFEAMVARHQAFGFADWKFRVCGDLDEDRARLDAVVAAGARSVRIDANNRWADDVDGAIAHLRALHAHHPLDAIEEPVRARDREGIRRLVDALDVPVVLDESACGYGDLEGWGDTAARLVVNLKVSRLGGLHRTLAMAQAARDAGMGLTLGAQVGETSILTRAARLVARALGDAVRWQEGGYGSLLLTAEPVTPELRFGPGGWLALSNVGPHGAGLEAVDDAGGP